MHYQINLEYQTEEGVDLEPGSLEYPNEEIFGKQEYVLEYDQVEGLVHQRDWNQITESSLNLLNKSLSLVLLVNGSMPLIVASISINTIINLCHANKEFNRVSVNKTDFAMKTLSITYMLATAALSAKQLHSLFPSQPVTPIDEVNKPVIPEESSKVVDFEKIPNVAQYKFSDWSGLLFKKSNMTVDEAKVIAENDSRIEYFFVMKDSMVLETNDGSRWKHFRKGDVVFFSDIEKIQWRSAKGMSDGYIVNRG